TAREGIGPAATRSSCPNEKLPCERAQIECDPREPDHLARGDVAGERGGAIEKLAIEGLDGRVHQRGFVERVPRQCRFEQRMGSAASDERSEDGMGCLPDSAVSLEDPVAFPGEDHLPLASRGGRQLGHRKTGGHRGLRSTTRSPFLVPWMATAPLRSSSLLAREISSSDTPCARASCASLASEGGRAMAPRTMDSASAATTG